LGSHEPGIELGCITTQSGGFVSPPDCVVIQPSSIPGSWLPNGPNSQWIGPAVNGYGSNALGADGKTTMRRLVEESLDAGGSTVGSGRQS